MTEELEQLLKNLKLRRMLSVYDEQLRAAEKEQISYSEFVAATVARAVARRGRKARWSGASAGRICRNAGRWKRFPWARQPGVNRKQIRAFAELEFVAKHENLVLVGQDRRRQDRTGLRPAAEGFAERLSLSVRPRAGSVR